MLAGQIEQNGDRRTQISKLNIGPRTAVNVTGAGPVSIDSDNFGSWIRLRGRSGVRTEVNQIDNGQEGDLLIVHGRNIRLDNTGGNVRMQGGGYDMDGRDMVFLLCQPNGLWWEIARADV